MAGSAAPGWQPAADQGAAMTPERFWRHLDAVLGGQLCCGLGGGGGAQGLGKGGVALQQLLELMQCCCRGMDGLGGRQVAGGQGTSFSE